MNLVRIIPVLLLNDSGLCKTTQFKNPNYLGDPLNAVKIFNEKEVDELILLDIRATPDEREPNYRWIKDIVSESFMPIGYGGGVKSLDQIKKLFNLGIEKIILNSSALDSDLIYNSAKIYGSQSIVVSIDTRKNIFGNYILYTNCGKYKHSISPVQFSRNVVERGCGEIIIQSIDNDGMMNGYDLKLVESISKSVEVPVVALGGAGSVKDLKDGVILGGASAVAAGSLFVYRGKHKAVLINYPSFDEINLISK